MQIKVLSWNIWYDGYFNLISQFLKSSDADIIGLQEVALNDNSRKVIDYLTGLGYEHVFTPAFTIVADGRIVGNAIFSKYKILSGAEFDLSEDLKRKAIQADIKIDGEILHVFCTHLLHTHQLPSKVQNLQAANLIKILPANRTIVMGDFNATPTSEVLQKISNVLVATSQKNAPTWTLYPAECCKLNTLSVCLDYIFCSKDIKVNSFKIKDSKGSDHLPISAIIEI